MHGIIGFYGLILWNFIQAHNSKKSINPHTLNFYEYLEAIYKYRAKYRSHDIIFYDNVTTPPLSDLFYTSYKI